MVPVIILMGTAGSGKDTAADYLVQKHNAVALGQADVLKHMARDLFGFTDEQLFGPSEKRNEIDLRFNRNGSNGLVWSETEATLRHWARRIFPDRFELAHKNLTHWFDHTLERGLQNGGLSARYVLQTLGTEWGRTINKQVWTEYAFSTVLKLLGGGYSYDRRKGLKELPEGDLSGPSLGVITDGRFKNEALMARRSGGIAVRVARTNSLSAEAQAAGIQGHLSETEVETIPPHYFDFIIKNDGTKESLYGLLDRLVFVVGHPPTVIS